MTREVISLIAGTGGRLAVSGAFLATVGIVSSGHILELLDAARWWLCWGCLFAVAVIALVVAADLVGVYDEETRP